MSCIYFVDGLTPPVEDWQKAMKEHLEKIKQLEENYESELISRKVRTADFIRR